MDQESSATGANPSGVVEEDIAARADDLRRQNQELALRNQEMTLQIQELHKRLASRALPPTEQLQRSQGHKGKCYEHEKSSLGYGVAHYCVICARYKRGSKER